MKAVVQDRYGSTDVLRLDDIDMPRVGPKDVLVEVAAAGVDQGQWHMMAGLPYLVRAVGLRRPSQPVRGMDLAGVVAEVGAKVTRFRPGDEVYGGGSGSYAEYALAREDRLAPKPSTLDFTQAAAVPTSGSTALHAVRVTGRVQPGQRVLVIGAGGGVGSFAVQLAVAAGAEVTGVCSTGKVAAVRRLGAERVIDYTREDPLAVGERYHVVIDIAGGAPLRRLRRVLTPRGTLVVVGAEVDQPWLGGMDRSLRVALWTPFIGQRLRAPLTLVGRKSLEQLTGLLDAGAVVPLVDSTFELADVPKAIDHMRSGRVVGKAVIVV